MNITLCFILSVCLEILQRLEEFYCILFHQGSHNDYQLHGISKLCGGSSLKKCTVNFHCICKQWLELLRSWRHELINFSPFSTPFHIILLESCSLTRAFQSLYYRIRQPRFWIFSALWIFASSSIDIHISLILSEVAIGTDRGLDRYLG